MTATPDSPSPTNSPAGIVVSDACSVAEFQDWLRCRSAGVDLAPSYYLDCPRHLDSGDTGDSYCFECAEKARWLNRHKKEPWTDIRYEDYRPSDSAVFCERCGIPLDHSPTKYYIETEAEHYEATDGPISATDAALLLNMIEAGDWVDVHWPEWEPIAAKIISQNTKPMEG